VRLAAICKDGACQCRAASLITALVGFSLYDKRHNWDGRGGRAPECSCLKSRVAVCCADVCTLFRAHGVPRAHVLTGQLLSGQLYPAGSEPLLLREVRWMWSGLAVGSDLEKRA